MQRARLYGGVALAVLTVAVLVSYALYRWSVKQSQDALPQAPDFTLEGLHGDLVTLSATNGRVRVLNVWASWSPYSRDELPMLAALLEERSDVSLIALGRDTNPAEGRGFLASLGLSESDRVRFVFDPQDEYFKLVEGFNMPETLVLDADGGIVFHAHGPVTREQIEEALVRAQQQSQ